MLNFKKFLSFSQNFLLIIGIIIAVLMFCVRYKMFIISQDLVALDTRIEKLQKDKELLNIELTYLTSTERILNLIDKNPEILNDKDIIKSSQLKTTREFVALSLAKAKNQIYNDKRIAKKENEANNKKLKILD
ncbi:MAG: hypothetical protein PHY80_04935 [Rickettsiales bacterium]|nr:hypothetical protein [Rickettsiales bacterium]